MDRRCHPYIMSDVHVSSSLAGQAYQFVLGGMLIGIFCAKPRLRKRKRKRKIGHAKQRFVAQPWTWRLTMVEGLSTDIGTDAKKPNPSLILSRTTQDQR